MYLVYLGLGSNLGDRQSNLLQALQKLRASSEVEAVSSYYETQPVAGVSGPAFLNVAAKIRTQLEPEVLETKLRSIETAVGRQRTVHAVRVGNLIAGCALVFPEPSRRLDVLGRDGRVGLDARRALVIGGRHLTERCRLRSTSHGASRADRQSD